MKYKMVKLLLFLSLAFTIAFVAPSARAYSGDSWSFWSLGDTDYYNYRDGRGTGYSIGDTYYYNDSYGWRGSNYSIGDTDYYSYFNYETDSNLKGNSYDIGDTTYYNLFDNYGDSYRGHRYSIGDTDYYRWEDDSYSCYWIGDTYYCN